MQSLTSRIIRVTKDGNLVMHLSSATRSRRSSDRRPSDSGESDESKIFEVAPVLAQKFEIINSEITELRI